MNKTKIRAVELVREIRDQLYQETRQMSPDEFQTFIASEAARAARLHTQPSLGASQPGDRGPACEAPLLKQDVRQCRPQANADEGDT